MKVTYIGSDDPTDSAVCEAFGESFPKGQAVDLKQVHPKILANPRFAVEGAPAPKAATGDQKD